MMRLLVLLHGREPKAENLLFIYLTGALRALLLLYWYYPQFSLGQGFCTQSIAE